MASAEIKSRLDSHERTPGLFDQRAALLRMTLILLFLGAGVIRLFRVEEPGILIDREYVSAALARAFYYEKADSVADWQRDVAFTTRERQPILEPPVTEYLVSLIYRAIGSEQLWVSHLLTSFFWLIGGVFFFHTAQLLISLDAAVIATAYYLFSPLSILVSRSFQPDSLMMMLFLISLYSILVYNQHPTRSRVIIAGIITGLAFLCRPLVFFTLLGAFSATAIYRRRSWRFALERDFLLFLAVSLLLPAIYYGNGLLIAGFLRWKVDTSFLPSLYLQREYWEGWLWLAVQGIGLPVLIGALLGLPGMERGLPRILLAGLWSGYLVFGLVFTAHIYTHGYYQAQLIPIVAISFSSLAARYLLHVRQMEGRLYRWLPVCAVLLIVLYFDIQTVRERLGSQVFESEQIAQEIGDLVNHSTQTVFVASYYGLPLQYYGEFSGIRWPKANEPVLYEKAPDRDLSIEERLNRFGYEPEYFIITEFSWLDRYYGDLKAYLSARCPLLAQSDQYLIYHGACPD